MPRLTHDSLVKRIKKSIDKVGREIAIQGVLSDLLKIKQRLQYLANPDESNFSRLLKARDGIDIAIGELIETETVRDI